MFFKFQAEIYKVVTPGFVQSAKIVGMFVLYGGFLVWLLISAMSVDPSGRLALIVLPFILVEYLLVGFFSVSFFMLFLVLPQIR